MKKLDNRLKGEQLFILLLMFSIFMGAACTAGCSGCMETADIFGRYMYQLEKMEGID